VLFAETAVALATPPFVWRRECVRQCIFIVTVSMAPLALAVTAFAFSAPGLQGAGFFSQLGATDRVGGFIVLGVVREFGVFTIASVVAGICGTTITAELGARKIREELDALVVLGVSPLHYFVAPRVMALTLMMAVLNMFLLVFGTLGGWLAAVGIYHATSGSFFTTFFLNSSWIDLVASEIKAILLGGMIGGICCYKGLAVSGGAEGVGRAVNEAVVGCLIAIFFVNLLYTLFFLSMFPSVEVLR
jgi:phospholipid/cholesterol/gamma-HCH transport system permease protein